MAPARYDAAADFYQAGWPDRYDDPATTARLITSGRRLRLRLPTRWPGTDHITTALAIIRAIEPAPG